MSCDQDKTNGKEEIIGKGDAEECKNDEEEGGKWYIPHYGVYHPRKPEKLCVVSDCSANIRAPVSTTIFFQGLT